MTQADTITVGPLTGDALAAALPDLARLRIAVFRDWPYLYDGSMDYEERYVAEFAAADQAVIIGARAGDRMVGCATAAPLAGHTPEFVPLFERHGFDPARVFYFGESVLLPAYRGRGLGHAFFDHREAHARAMPGARATPGEKGGYTHTGFCAVVRDDADPRRPADDRPLDDFWRKRVYRPVEGMRGSYAWQEIGAREETEKWMQFWVREL